MFSLRIRWVGMRARILEWASLVLLILLITVPIGILGWLLFFTDTFTVQAITVVDAREHTIDEVRTLAQDARGTNIFTAPAAKIEGEVIRTVPQVKDVHIVRKLPGTLKIIIQEKTPKLLLLSNGTYYFIDSNGIAYEEASLDTLPGVVLPVVKNSDAESTVTVGDPAVSDAFVTFVQEAQEQLPDIVSANVVETRIPSLAAREVHFLLDNNWILKFDTTRPLAVQLDVLSRLLADTVSEEEEQKIEYIDLRIPNRVYYKTRGVGATPTAAPTPTPAASDTDEDSALDSTEE